MTPEIIQFIGDCVVTPIFVAGALITLIFVAGALITLFWSDSR